MNRPQLLWWEQARSDLAVLLVLRRNGVHSCHQLHYLQMVTEKLAKAYFWRSGAPPARVHSGFVPFMRALGGVPQARQAQIAGALGFRDFPIFQAWIRKNLPLVYRLEQIAPALAQDGPNPEYPWPHHAPTDYPAGHQFTLWSDLTDTAQGRDLLRVIQLAVDRFPGYG